MFTMLIFTHERFITILGLYFVLFLMLGLKRKNILLFVYSTLPVILNFILKIFVLRIRPLDGTGGTDILQTFNIAGFFQNFLSGWFYIFGVNAGPAYLSGIPSQAVPKNINNMIVVGFICILTILILFVLSVLKSKRNVAEKYLKNFVLFFVFIFFTILAASVTIRVEMRWVYAPFVGLLFLLVYMVGVVIKQKIMGKICIILTIVWLSMIVPTEMFYRSYFKNIYYWGVQTFGNALYEATLKKYGEDFWNYDTYILCKDNVSGKMLGCAEYGDLKLFFSQYNKVKAETKIHLVGEISEIVNNDKRLILYFDKTQNKFIEFKTGSELRKVELLGDWYGWNEENVSIRTGREVRAFFQTGEMGKMFFEGSLPKYNLPNTISFFVDGNLIKRINVNKSDLNFEMKVPKSRIIELKIVINRVGMLITDIRFK